MLLLFAALANGVIVLRLCFRPPGGGDERSDTIRLQQQANQG